MIHPELKQTTRTAVATWLVLGGGVLAYAIDYTILRLVGSSEHYATLASFILMLIVMGAIEAFSLRSSSRHARMKRTNLWDRDGSGGPTLSEMLRSAHSDVDDLTGPIHRRLPSEHGQVWLVDFDATQSIAGTDSIIPLFVREVTGPFVTKNFDGLVELALRGYGIDDPTTYRVDLHGLAESLKDELNSLRETDKTSSASILNNMGLCHMLLRSYDEAERDFSSGYDLSASLHDDVSQGTILFNYGTLNYARGKTHEAVAFWVRSSGRLKRDTPERKAAERWLTELAERGVELLRSGGGRP